MLSEKMNISLNEQINKELYSAYLYVSMSAYCALSGFKGFANWLEKQAKEEVEHAEKIYQFILKRSGNINLDTIEAPEDDWTNLKDVFENAYKHEQFITDSIYHLIKIATEENDYASISFLRWYVDEQVEEEEQSGELLQIIKYINDDRCALLALDKKLNERE